MSAAAGAQYLMFGTGVLASNICDGGGFWYADERARRPTSSSTSCLAPASSTGVDADPQRRDPQLRLPAPALARLGAAALERRPRAKPLIDPNYWGDPYDVAMSIAGFRLARRIMAQPAFADSSPARRIPGRGPRATTTSRPTPTATPRPTITPSAPARWARGRPDRGRHPAPALQGHREPARLRRLGHALRQLVQHQRPHHHDRREGRRHDPGRPRAVTEAAG